MANYILTFSGEKIENKFFDSLDEANKAMLIDIQSLPLGNSQLEIRENDAVLTTEDKKYMWKIQEIPNQKMNMACSSGTIMAQYASNPDYPGIYLCFHKNGEEEERTVALLEENQDDEIRLLVWNDENNEICTHNFKVHPNIDVISY